VRVRTRDGARLIGQRFVVRVDAWLRASRWPDGHVVRLLGGLTDLKCVHSGIGIVLAGCVESVLGFVQGVTIQKLLAGSF
jgi:exoribonuclease R